MNLYFPLIGRPFQILDDKLNQIVIESPVEMFRFLTELVSQMNKNDGEIVFSHDNRVLELSKIVDLTTNYFPFDNNPKALVTKLYAKLKDNAYGERLCETHEIISYVTRYIDELTEDLDCVVEFDEPDISSLFKACNIRFCDDAELLEERIVNYCKNVVSLLGDKVFIFVSLRNYLSEKSYSNLKKMVIDNKLKIVLIEAMEHPRQDFENVLVIDRDGCVI